MGSLFSIFFPALLVASASAAEASAPTQPQVTEVATHDLIQHCRDTLVSLPGAHIPEVVSKVCLGAQRLPSCSSVQGRQIFHLDQPSRRPGGRKILVFSVTHGDEPESGALARAWMERLAQVDARNSWRVVPILNPDGLLARSRVNANQVDLNRNFPTRDWAKNAVQFWKKHAGASPRRFPGTIPGSEPETQCAIDQIQDFNPDLIVSIHTPYGVLDFDGPPAPLPRVGKLPARRLGTFPGSLGRFMWNDRSVPVLTVELKGGPQPISTQDAQHLQDQLGDLALKVPARKSP